MDWIGMWRWVNKCGVTNSTRAIDAYSYGWKEFVPVIVDQKARSPWGTRPILIWYCPSIVLAWELLGLRRHGLDCRAMLGSLCRHAGYVQTQPEIEGPMGLASQMDPAATETGEIWIWIPQRRGSVSPDHRKLVCVSSCEDDKQGTTIYWCSTIRARLV